MCPVLRQGEIFDSRGSYSKTDGSVWEPCPVYDGVGADSISNAGACTGSGSSAGGSTIGVDADVSKVVVEICDC